MTSRKNSTKKQQKSQRGSGRSASTKKRLPNLKDFETPITSGWFLPKTVEPLYHDIGFRDLLKVSEHQHNLHREYTETDYYNEELKEIQQLDTTDIFECPVDNIYINNCVLNYIKSRPNTKLVTLFNTNSNVDHFITESMSKHSSVVTYKTIRLHQCAALALFYQLSYNYQHPIEFNNLCKYAGKYDIFVNYNFEWPMRNKGRLMDITVVVLEDGKPQLDTLLKNCPYKYFNTNNYPKVCEIAGLYFNKNSIDFLGLQNLKRVMSYGQNSCSQSLNIYKKILYTKFDQQYINKFLVLSGGMLYSYGTRLCTDVDFFISPYPASTSPEHKYMDLISEKFFLDDASRPEIFDGYLPNKRWKDFWSEWHKEWSGTIGAKSMIECIHNPKYHYYYMGIKLIILQAEINRRNIRNRQNSIADLLMIKKFLGIEFPIFPIIREVIRSEKRIVRKNKLNFAIVVQRNILERYGVHYSVKNILNQLTFQLD